MNFLAFPALTVAAAVIGAAAGVEWEPAVQRYLSRIDVRTSATLTSSDFPTLVSA
jgi:HJR/Mrr/RecB family endonuclease